MIRDLRRLSDTKFDLLIVGAGIYGTTAAWDAAQRGLSVAIIDKSDFGGGTSSNTAKTLHGGIRVLTTGNISAQRLFVRERRALSRIAPHLVQPLPFIIPTYGGLRRNRWLMRAFFALNDALAFDRNDNLDSAHQLPQSRILSRNECLDLNSSLDPQGVTGGIEWHDCQMYNSDRINLSFLLSSSQAGATAANYVKATELHRENTGLTKVKAQDVLNDTHIDIQARVVLNCAGPWAHQLLNSVNPKVAKSLPGSFSVAMNFITPRRLVRSHGVAGPAGNRMIFMVPWREHTIVGTSHDPFDGHRRERLVTRDLVDRFINEVKLAFPHAELTTSDLSLVHWGLLPAVYTGRSKPPQVSLSKRSIVHNHREEGVDGLLSVLGARYTTARRTAQQAVDTVFLELGRKPPICRTAETPLVGGDIEDTNRFLRQTIEASPSNVTEPTATRLARSYGTNFTKVLERFTSSPDNARQLGAQCPVTVGEIRHAVCEEMAVTLSDAVIRRTEAGSAGHPGDDAIREAASIMAKELGWSAQRTKQEIRNLEDYYKLEESKSTSLVAGD